MTIAIFSTSPAPSYSYKMDSNFKTLVSDFDSGKEQHNRQWRFPKRTFNLVYNYLDQTNRDALHEFYRKRYGSYESFWFFDFKARSWDDEYVGYAGPLNLDGQYYYKGAAYVDQTEEAEDATINNVLLAPATNSTAGDANYFISQTQFDRCAITITTAGSHGSTGTWEIYSSTGGWIAATITTDQTNGFTATTGTRNVDLTISSNWIDCTINNINGYALRWRITTTSSQNVQPKASQIVTYSKTFDIPAILSSTTDLVAYENGTSTTAYTVSTQGGGGDSYRINFTDYPSSGSLITADLTGRLRIKGRMKDDAFSEEMPHPSLYNVAINIYEVK